MFKINKILRKCKEPRLNAMIARASKIRLDSKKLSLQVIPKSKTDYLERSISYSVALLWDRLPESLRQSDIFFI